MAEYSYCSRRIQPFGERCQHFADPVRRGFQAVQGRVATGAEGGSTRLAPKCLNLISFTMRAIANKGMNSSIRDAIVRAGRLGAGISLRVDSLMCTPATLDLAPRTN